MKNKIEKVLLILAIVLQPLLDLTILGLPKFQIFGFNISTIIRLLIFGVLAVITISKFKTLKYKKLMFFYTAISLIYFVLHHFLIQDITLPVPVYYSLKEELYYFLRMIIPPYLIFITVNSEFTKKELKNSIYIVSLILSGVLLVSNITKTSLATYGDHNVACNIFEWFNVTYYTCSYLFSASRGFFTTMIITYILLLITPYLIYVYFTDEKNNIFKLILIAINIFSCFVVGTKSSTYGSLIVLAAGIILSIYMSFISKNVKKNALKTLCICALFLILYFLLPYAPASNRKLVDNISLSQQEDVLSEVVNSKVEIKDLKKYIKKEKIKTNETEITIEEALTLIEDEEERKKILVEYLSKYYYAYGFSQYLIESSYPYYVDPFFWKELIDELPLYMRSNNRVVVDRIFKRVSSLNNDKIKYKLFGIGYSRASHIYNLEQDFKYQYYSMGLVGAIILLSPYIVVVLYAGWIILKNLIRFNQYECTSLLLGIGLVLCLSYYSGNTIENLGVIMPLGIVCGYILKISNKGD